jgi:chromosome segregation ATPase
VLVELRKLGQVQQENQSADDITRQYVDLTARLANARETEKRLVEILRERTGKVTDVLQVEREIARTRQEIEQMDAERKTLESQVAYAAVDLRITEEYKQSLETPTPSLGTRINNAAVDGLRDAADLVVGLGLWVLSTGPTLVVWGGLLFWPVLKLVRWVRRRFFAQTVAAA